MMATTTIPPLGREKQGDQVLKTLRPAPAAYKIVYKLVYFGEHKGTYLKHDQNLSIVFLQCYVKGRLVKFAESMDISPIFDE